MAFRASNKTPVVVYERLKNTALNLRTYTANRIVAILANGLDADELENLYETIGGFKSSLAEMAGVPGLAAYASSQESDETYDVVAEYAALSASLVDVSDYIETAWPKDANGYLLTHQLVAGDVVPRTFSPATLSTLIVKLETVRDSII